MPDTYAHILSLIEPVFFSEHSKKYQNFTQSHGAEILRKRTVSAEPGQYARKSVETFRQRKSSH